MKNQFELMISKMGVTNLTAAQTSQVCFIHSVRTSKLESKHFKWIKWHFGLCICLWIMRWFWWFSGDSHFIPILQYVNPGWAPVLSMVSKVVLKQQGCEPPKPRAGIISVYF